MTTSFVIDEVATYFNSRGHHRKAIDTGRYLMTSPSVQLIYVDAAIFQESWRCRYFFHCEASNAQRSNLVFRRRKKPDCFVAKTLLAMTVRIDALLMPPEEAIAQGYFVS